MPGFVAAANVVRATLHWTQHGITAMNVIDCRVTAGFSVNGSIVNTINTGIISVLGTTALDSHLAPTTIYTGVSLLDRRSEGMVDILSTNGTQAGLSAGLSLPAQDAIVITKRTARAGKFYRGRIYLLGFDVASVAPDGTILPAVGVAAQAFVSSVAQVLTVNGLIPAIHSPHYPPRPSSNPAIGTLPDHPETLTDITSYELRDHKWDTQRRRLQ